MHDSTQGYKASLPVQSRKEKFLGRSKFESEVELNNDTKHSKFNDQ
jgi:hypothetical protein